MVRTGAFTHADFHRIFAYHRQNFIRHQSIVKHGIRSLNRLPFAGNTRHRARMQRNQCLNNLPPFTRQYRRSTAAGYGDLQRSPIHHGRYDKRTQVRRIHRITQFCPSFRRFKNTVVKHVVIRRRNNKIHLVQHGFFKQAAQPNYFPFSRPLLKLRIQSFRNNAYARSGRQQAFRLAFGNLACAYQ